MSTKAQSPLIPQKGEKRKILLRTKNNKKYIALCFCVRLIAPGSAYV